ncbi:AAA family ATPase [Telmatospirillum sp.]|uniref:bifunctional aminoglycoside phosphotransferase/ATP-binding protein n=1 Tax=Telmatospirillum sp. TaxID=2079197 RepID=UPI00283B267E|nr:AAA family ATPase [Telmatospirillum sp.]MDR3441179.1 AAA family ATPase [Telmatospirillum sp.]
MTNPQSGILAWLASPATYGVAPGGVERIDTHISAVFLVGKRVFKLKRAVQLPFLDFTSLESRKRACDRELAINRRTAPDLYLGLSAITRQPDGRLAFDGPGEVVDWLVVMARFGQDGLFDRMAARDQLTRHHARDLADAVARLHRAAELRPDWGGEAGLRFTIESNAATLNRFVPGLFDATAVDDLTDRSRAWLARLAPLLEQRRSGGSVRLCHGDLHLGNICLFHGQPTLFDAIEFNDDFACIDVFYDLAFLIMDLDVRGLSNLASAVFNRYLERTGDFGAVAALPLFLSLRAAIRAHVAAATFTGTGEARHRDGAHVYLGKAAAYLSPVTPRLLAVGGLSGTGKSRLSADLAPLLGRAPGAVVLRSDVLRKQLMGVDPEQRLPPEAYGADVTEQTYRRLCDLAADLLQAGHAVVADAVFARPEQRQAVAAVASARGVRFDGLWLEAPAHLLRARVSGRRHDASDATASVLDQQLTYSLGEIDWPRLDTSATKRTVAGRARQVLGLDGAISQSTTVPPAS